MVDCANVVEIACTNICTLVTDRRIHTSRFKVQVCPTVPSDVRVETLHMHAYAYTCMAWYKMLIHTLLPHAPSREHAETWC